MQSRIADAEAIARQRAVRGEPWYYNAMQQWDATNAFEMTFAPHSRAPELVDDYRADPRNPRRVDGVEPPHTSAIADAYFERRIAWLKTTFERLRNGGQQPRGDEPTSTGVAVSLPAPTHQSHAFLALYEQRERGVKIRDRQGDDEPQKFTALLHFRQPESFAERVAAWKADTAAVVGSHREARTAEYFLDDEGLGRGGEPEHDLQRRLHRLEEILRTFTEGSPDVAAAPEISAGAINCNQITGGGPTMIDGKERNALTRLYAIPFENVAAIYTNTAIAEDVVADLRVSDLDGTELDRAHGRWRELSPPIPESPTMPVLGIENARPATLAPNGQQHLLDVLEQDYRSLPRERPSLGCWLIRDPIDQSWFKSSAKLLPGNDYVLTVTLRGLNLDRGVRFAYDISVPPDPASPHEIEAPIAFALRETTAARAGRRKSL